MAAPTAIEPDQYPKAANEERQHLEQIHSVLALLPIKPLNLITAEVQRHLAAVRLVFLIASVMFLAPIPVLRSHVLCA
jgi:hypothetical protein